MDEFLFVDIKETNNGLICFLTLNHVSNAIACTDPLRFIRGFDFVKTFKNPLGSYTRRNISEFKPIHVDKVKKCIESMFISGTLNRTMDVIKDTQQNREILGI